MNDNSIKNARKRAKEKYGASYTIDDVKLTKQKPPRGARIRGYNKRYKVFLKPRKK